MSQQVDLSLIRRMLYDAHWDGCVAADLLDLPPVSEDVAELEHTRSAARCEKVMPLFDQIMTLAEVLTTLWLLHLDIDEEDPGYEGMRQMLLDLSVGSQISAISTFIDTGKLKVA